MENSMFKVLLFSLFSLLTFVVHASNKEPILVIGASFSTAKTPFNDGLTSPFYGIAVNNGNYLSLGAALIRNPSLSGLVINEAEVGATISGRYGCTNEVCGNGYFESYETQLDRALMRVVFLGEEEKYNSKYVVITITNDCFHSLSQDVPGNYSEPCDESDMMSYIDGLIAVGQKALNKGITPIFDQYPKYSDLDIPFFQEYYGYRWVIDKKSYNKLRRLHKKRLKEELPDAYVVNIWKNYSYIVDGLHPDRRTVKLAAKEIAKIINRNHVDN